MAKSSGRCAKEMSCVRMNSRAISGDDTMRVETSPNLRCMRGPYFRDRSRREWCGNEVPIKLCKFPIIGSFFGPGGCLQTVFFLVLRFNKENKEKTISKTMVVDNENSSSIIMFGEG